MESGRWDFQTEVIERTDDYVLIKGTFRCLDYEVIVPAQFGGHLTTGKNTEIADGYKSAVTDALSKCASYLGVGIEVFKGQVSPPSQTTPAMGADDDKGWYNNFEVDKIAMMRKIANEESTAEDILGKVRENYKVSKKTADLILSLNQNS